MTALRVMKGIVGLVMILSFLYAVWSFGRLYERRRCCWDSFVGDAGDAIPPSDWKPVKP